MNIEKAPSPTNNRDSKALSQQIQQLSQENSKLKNQYDTLFHTLKTVNANIDKFREITSELDERNNQLEQKIQIKNETIAKYEVIEQLYKEVIQSLNQIKQIIHKHKIDFNISNNNSSTEKTNKAKENTNKNSFYNVVKYSLLLFITSAVSFSLTYLAFFYQISPLLIVYALSPFLLLIICNRYSLLYSTCLIFMSLLGNLTAILLNDSNNPLTQTALFS